MSVLLPVRDAMPHLAEAAESISAQTFRDLEVIAVDDGSADESAAALDAWARSDPRVRVLRQPARGIVAALERARSQARGRFLARMDADDRALPTRIERQVSLMVDNPDTALCGTHVRYTPRAVLGDGARRYERWLNSLTTGAEIDRDVFVECPLAHPTFLMRADVVSAVGGYRDRGWPEDYDLLLRIWQLGSPLAVVPEVLLEWRESAGRQSRIHPAYSRDAFRRCKAHYLTRTRLRQCGELFIWGAGPTGKALARALLDAGRALDGWIDLDPRKIGQRIHGAPVLAPEDLHPAPGRIVLAAVAKPGGRAQIRLALAQAGFQEPHDAFAVA